MKAVLDQAVPLVEVLWRGETEGKDFSTPERRAGLERQLNDIVSLIGDGTIADYYRREFNDRVFQAFKLHKAWSPSRGPRPSRGEGGYRKGGFAPGKGGFAPGKGGFAPGKGGFAPGKGGFAPDPVTSAVKNSLIARTGKSGARKLREEEICRLLFEHPEIAESQTERLAALTFSDPLLDRFRRELLNLAASGFGLEGAALNDHLIEVGMGELSARLPSKGTGDERKAAEARFLGACSRLREMTEFEPNRAKAAERLKTETNEENWQAFMRLKKPGV
jgi:DNA primase